MYFKHKKKRKEIIEELKRVNPKLWRNLISEAEKRGDIEARRVSSFIECIEDFYRNDADRILKRISIPSYNGSFKNSLKKYYKVPVVSIDGSIAFGGTISTNYYVMISSSIVIFPDYSDKSIIEPIVKVEPQIKSYSTEINEDDIKKIALLDMMTEEVNRMNDSIELLSEVGINEKAAIIIDGPIIDPPKGNRKNQKYLNYVKKRVNVIMKHLKRGNIVIGYVKRVTGRTFIESQKSTLERFKFPLDIGKIGSLYMTNDSSFLNILFEKETLIINTLTDTRKDYVVYTKPEEIPININDYDLYKMEGLHVYFTYAKIGINSYPRRKVIRIEIAFSEDNLNQNYIDSIFEEALKIIYLWTPIGLNHPMPIQIAHNSCTIRRRVAKVLIKDIMTRFIAMKLPNLNERFKLYLLKEAE